MTRPCKICELHPFLRKWAEGFIVSGLSMREVPGKMHEHGIDVSYRGVNRHEKQISRSERIKRLRMDSERFKTRRPSTRATLKRLEQ